MRFVFLFCFVLLVMFATLYLEKSGRNDGFRHQHVIKNPDNHDAMKTLLLSIRAFNRRHVKNLAQVGFTAMLIGAFPHSVMAQSTNAADIALPKFDIFEYQIEGNSRLADGVIESVVTPFLGEGKTLREVEEARAALELAYHDAGYLTVGVSIPDQKVDSGLVILQVQEVPVDRVLVKGAEYHAPSVIKSQVPELTPGNVPNFTQMTRELATVNRTQDLKATPILRAGKTPGTVEVQLEVEDQLPLHGNIELTNRQSPNTTPARLSGSLHYDNLFQAGHSVGLTAQLSPQKTDEVRVVSGTYVIPIGTEGDGLTFYAVRSRSSLATIANSPGLGVLGNTDIFGVRYALPLPAVDLYSHSLSGGADFKKVKQSVTTSAGGFTTPISYMPLVLAYNGSVADADHPSVNLAFDSTATIGVRGLMGNTDSEFTEKRTGASANYFVLRSSIQHTQPIGNWSVFAKVEAQTVSGPLVSNEQFTAGGTDSVRGYLEGELAGDDALRGTIELRAPAYKFAGDTSLWSLTSLGFIDAAGLHTRQAQASQKPNQRLRSAGLGIRLSAPYGLAFQLDWAHAFDKAEVTTAGSNRVHAQMVWEY